MRRFVAALLVALLAFSLVGCGGGGGEEAAAPAEGEAAAPPPAPAAAQGQPVPDPIPDRSAEEPAVFEPFPTVEGLPESVTTRVSDKQPMLLFFYDPSQRDSNDTRDEIDEVMENNKGTIDLLTYDLGKYASVKPSGEVEVDEAALQENADAKSAITLAQALGVNFTPYVVITDDQGYVIFKHRGYIDAELLERQVLRTTD